MAVSSKSIIHYTGNLSNLKGIINKKGLRVKYCNESIIFSKKTTINIAFPMVCFCDLPLTLAKDHISKYGSYGIGFSKEWAKRNGLNPVLYLEAGSTISSYLDSHSKAIADEINLELNKNGEASTETRGKFLKLSQILGFCKNHIGPLTRKGKLLENEYTFYDEREWRYIPDLSLLGEADPMITGNAYEQNKAFYNSFVKEITLDFTHNDISYIIVKSEKDIPAIADCLDTRYRSEIPVTELQKLYTKIISVNQIHNDF